MKGLAYCFLSLFVIASGYTVSFAGDMVLENEGQHFILHEDNSWDFENKNVQDLTKDQIITLDDNRLIRLSTDYSWQFVDKEAVAKAETESIQSVTGKGIADHVVLSEASAMALKKALANATTKLMASLKKKKFNYDKLHNCIKRVEKEVDNTERFTKGKGWHVETLVTLDQGSIFAVIDCETAKEGPKEAVKAP